LRFDVEKDLDSPAWFSQRRRDGLHFAKLNRQERTPALAGGAREERKGS
jgi:hypothetical protein